MRFVDGGANVVFGVVVGIVIGSKFDNLGAVKNVLVDRFTNLYRIFRVDVLVQPEGPASGAYSCDWPPNSEMILPLPMIVGPGNQPASMAWRTAVSA